MKKEVLFITGLVLFLSCSIFSMERSIIQTSNNFGNYLSSVTVLDGVVDGNFSPTPSIDANGNLTKLRIQNDGKILIAGNFGIVGEQFKQGIVRLNLDGSVDTTFNVSFNSGAIVNDVSIQPDGKIIISGNFTQINGNNAGGIARLNPDGSSDSSFNPGGSGANSQVYTIGLQSDGKIFVSGNFTAVNGIARQNIARLNPNGSVDSTFNTTILAFIVNPIKQIESQPDGKIYLAGSFSQVNGVNHRGIVRLNQDGTTDSSFSDLSNFNSSTVDTFKVQPDGKIIIGGSLSYSTNNQLRAGIARLNADGTVDNSFVATTDQNAVEAIVIQPDGSIIIGGNFQKINGVSQDKLARLQSDGSLGISFNDTFNNGASITNIVRQNNGSILVGGTFTTVNGFSRDGLARIDASGNLEQSFQQYLAGVGRINKTLIQPDGKILVVGKFDRLNGVPRIYIGRINPNGSLDATFDPSSIAGGFEEVDSLALQSDGKILIAGGFSSVNGISRVNIARLNSNGALDSSFDAGTSSDRPINEIAVQPDGKILVGGVFEQFNTVARRGIARLNNNGSIDNSFKGSFNVDNSSTVEIYSILIQPNGKIVAGGSFVNVDSTLRRNIARLNADGSLDTNFNPPAGNSFTAVVRSLALQPDGKILVGASGTPNFEAPILYRLNSDGTVDSTFNPGNIGIGFVSDGIFSIIYLPDGKIIIGGNFSGINGAARFNIARLLNNGSLDFSFDAKTFEIGNPFAAFPHFINSLSLQSDGNLILGGEFSKINTTPRSGLARILVSNSSHQTLFDYDGDGRADISVYRPSNGIWYLLNSATGFSAVQFGISTDKIVPADFDGDGKTDIAVFRDGNWYLQQSTKGFASISFGSPGDIPMPADFDGDGKADLAVYRPSNGTWYVLNLATNAFNAVQFGVSGDKPVVADYDGDGRADYAVYRPSNGVWYLLESTKGFAAVQFGIQTDKPVVGDYDGDGKADEAVYRPETGTWYLFQSTSGFSSIQFGLSTDIPSPGDYDGDGKTDVAVFRPESGTWYQMKSTQGFGAVQFGSNGDKPTTNAFVP